MKSVRNQVPQAREDDVVVQELPGEVLVYDLKTHKAHCLNETAAIVWKHCDGSTTIAELASIVSQELSAAVDETFVWTAIDRLAKAGLLQSPVQRPAGISRRAAMKWALATAAAVPLVTSITAPAAAQTVSCVPDSPGCLPNGNTNICTASSQCCSCCCNPDSGDPSNAHCTAKGTNTFCLPG